MRERGPEYKDYTNLVPSQEGKTRCPQDMFHMINYVVSSTVLETFAYVGSFDPYKSREVGITPIL